MPFESTWSAPADTYCCRSAVVAARGSTHRVVVYTVLTSDQSMKSPIVMPSVRDVQVSFPA